ncbi:MAG: hypothetical protein F6K09_33745 [Merismopedia sp. SIO2A8]|nr:hypothetical protein [Symploca sp. SIO2B6]NET53444.1 hypothetical protein [Merismopedia sp. SIO2A8]
MISKRSWLAIAPLHQKRLAKAMPSANALHLPSKMRSPLLLQNVIAYASIS